MPKHHADNSLENSSKYSHDWHVIWSEQAEFIINNSFSPSVTCKYCQYEGLECVIDQSHYYLKCATCTHQGHTYHHKFHTSKEWDLLKQAKAKIVSDLSAVDDELEMLNPELKLLQNHLAKVQSKIRTTLIHYSCLCKQQKFLKEHGFKISDHDTELL